MVEETNMGGAQGGILRLFEVLVKPGAAEALLEKFRSTSADVVQNEPGNLGYFFGRGTAGEEETVIFASLWRDLDAIQARFGEAWQESFLPAGYEDYISECSLRHIDLRSGWHVKV